MAASESLFCEDFFGRNSSAFTRAFRSVQSFLQETLRLRLKESHDGVAMLLLVALNYRLQRKMNVQGLFALDSYFDLTTINVWPAFKRVLDAHVGSLKQSDVALLAIPKCGAATHPVVERYREFAYACLTVEKSEMSVQMMAQNMSTLRGAMRGWLERMGLALRPAGLAPEAIGAVQRLFLIGNTHAVLAKLHESGSEEAVSEATAFWAPQLAAQIAEYCSALLASGSEEAEGVVLPPPPLAADHEAKQGAASLLEEARKALQALAKVT